MKSHVAAGGRDIIQERLVPKHTRPGYIQRPRPAKKIGASVFWGECFRPKTHSLLVTCNEEECGLLWTKPFWDLHGGGVGGARADTEVVCACMCVWKILDTVVGGL